jgi:hypothetical protein
VNKATERLAVEIIAREAVEERVNNALAPSYNRAVSSGTIKRYKDCRKKVVLIHAMKVRRGSRGMVPLILNLGITRWFKYDRDKL